MKIGTKAPPKVKMGRNRPRLGEIGQESGQKDEEDTRNPKKALPGPENGIFCTFVFFVLVVCVCFSSKSPKFAKRRLFTVFSSIGSSYVFFVFHVFVHLP